jgi:O-succinylbenzoate synthase
MKIINIEICEVELPMRNAFETGFGSITHKSEVIVKLYTKDGLVGYGESPTLNVPIYNHETVASCLYVLEHFIGPRILNQEFETAEDFRQAYADIVGNRIAKAGAECAFWHLIAQRYNKSLKTLFGGVKNEIPVGEGVGIKSTVEEVLDEVKSHLDEGFVRIKVKIKPGWDIEPLRAVRSAWPNIHLMADGNSAYRLDEHHDLLQTLEEFNLDMLEQPLAIDDFVDHAALQKELSIPLCLDESIESLNDARTAVALKSCQIINIKPGRVGGIVEAIAIHDFAEKNNISVWAGGMLETGIGRAFNIALASKQNFKHAADMSPYQLYYHDDITDPGLVIQKNGSIEVPDKPGLGYEIREDKLKKYTVHTIRM